MKDTAEGLLLELARHLQHDAGLNTERFSGQRIGCLKLSLNEGALWRRIVDCIGGEPDLQRDVVIPALAQRAGAADDVDPRVDESCGYLGGGFA